MEGTTSISKGVFIFKNGAKAASKRGKKRRKQEESCDSLFAGQLWYESYSKQWQRIEAGIQALNDDTFSSVLSNLVSHIKTCYTSTVSEIPAAALLTGINMPDHAAQFSTLSKQIRREVTPHVACLYSQDAQGLKSLVENMILQFVKNEDSDSSDEESDTETKPKALKKSQCNFSLLQAWYENQHPPLKSSSKVPLVIIIPDFESFNNSILQDFILIADSYLNILPFVLVFGVATSLTVLHKSLPYQVSSRINIQVFNSQPSATYLSKVIEEVFFSDDCAFHVGGKVFQLFTDIFLFYDLSVTGFIQNLKYAMLEHFSQSNIYALCTYNEEKITNTLKHFNHEDFESVRRLLTFRRLVESESFENRIKLIEDDTFFSMALQNELIKFHKYLHNLHIFLKCLHILVSDLPKAPLGKQIRELYCLATSKSVVETPEFKESFQLLGFQSKDELKKKLLKLFNLVLDELEKNETDALIKIAEELKSVFDSFSNDDSESDDVEMDSDEPVAQENEVKMDRRQFRQNLMKKSKACKTLNKYERQRAKILNELEELFRQYLQEPSTYNFHEIFFFNDLSIRTQIIGSHRAAIHTALNDPCYYLQCTCCEIPNDAAILRAMPDICIAYKLHLEYGKMINLYDWLQAFLCIVDPVSNEDENEVREVDQTLQARFTQAVAELEFLGFIKSSKRKADHVSRLTWGG